MDAHDRSQQNTWKLFETLSVLMSYRKYNTIILDCLSKLRIMDLLRCDTMTNLMVWKKSGHIDESLIKE